MGAPYPADAEALVLRDVGRPLAVSGHTILRGACRLPKAGVRRTTVEGRPFEGDTLVHGPIWTSSPSPIGMDSTLKMHLYGLLAGIPPDSDMERTTLDAVSDSAIDRSFGGPALWVELGNGRTLEGVRLRGRVLLHGNDTVSIAPNNSIQDAIVCAPVIILRKGARVQGQFLATRSIILEEDVECTYPSVLAVRIGPNDQGLIRMDKRSKVTGEVLQWTDIDMQAPRSLIQIGPEAQVKGLVRTPALVEVRGMVRGTVICGGTIVHTGSAMYENHLVDAVIDVTQREREQVGSLSSEAGTERYGVVSWTGP